MQSNFHLFGVPHVYFCLNSQCFNLSLTNYLCDLRQNIWSNGESFKNFCFGLFNPIYKSIPAF